MEATIAYKLCLMSDDIEFNDVHHFNKCWLITYVNFVGDYAILENAKKQPTIEVSTTKVEYMASCDYSNEAIWLRNVVSC